MKYKIVVLSACLALSTVALAGGKRHIDPLFPPPPTIFFGDGTPEGAVNFWVGGNGDGGTCFAPGTLIETAGNNVKVIESLRPGDSVVSTISPENFIKSNSILTNGLIAEVTVNSSNHALSVLTSSVPV